MHCTACPRGGLHARAATYIELVDVRILPEQPRELKLLPDLFQIAILGSRAELALLSVPPAGLRRGTLVGGKVGCRPLPLPSLCPPQAGEGAPHQWTHDISIYL